MQKNLIINALPSIQLSQSNRAMTFTIAVMHKIASKQFQDTQDFTDNQLLVRSGEANEKLM